jgi:predicted permease
MEWPFWKDLGNREHELDEELEAHFALEIQQRMEAGASREEAELAARRAFGNLGRVKEVTRGMWVGTWLDSFVRNIRFACRTFRKSPGFAAVAVVSLALGIGANTAIFTLLDQLVLRYLPVKNPEQLVMIWSTGPHLGNNTGPRAASYPMYEDFERRAEAFEYVFCRFGTPVSVTLGSHTERVDAELVSGNFFQALGVKPGMGRLFSPERDDRIYEGHPSVILSHRYWATAFGSDPRVIGKKILVNNYPMDVVGVAPETFGGLDPSRSAYAWIPIQMAPLMAPGRDDLGNRRSQWIQMFGRLKPGFTVESARASLEPLLHQILIQELKEPALRAISPYSRNSFLHRKPLVERAAHGYSALRQQYSTALIVLMSMAGLILLIACSNVANLLVARAAARQKEIAVRLSLGAGRRTLIGQLLVESLLLSLTGAALGLVLSSLTAHVLLRMLPNHGEMLILHADPDARILLFSIAVAVVTGILFGLAPALQSTKLDLITTLKGVVGGIAGSSAQLRKILVTAQVALSFLLLVGASLFTRTLGNLENSRVGFKSIEQLATFQLDPSRNGYSAPRARAFNIDLAGAIQGLPGVKSVAYAMQPLLAGSTSDTYMRVEGHQEKDGENMQAYYNVVSPGYWRTMGVPLLEGRDFDDRDRVDPKMDGDPRARPTIAIVNRKFARHFFGNQSPVGRHLGFGGPDDPTLGIEIIGVVEDSLYGGPRQGVERQAFFSQYQMPIPHATTFYVASSLDSAAIFAALRKIVVKLDPSTPVYEVKTLKKQLNETLSTERLIAWLSLIFGGLATIMAALGLYGVMSFMVARLTKEIGLRMALGARQGSVLWLVFRETLTLMAIGFAVGIPCAYLLSRYVSSQLFGVRPTDIWTGLSAAGVLVIVAGLSSFVPARRASAIDPMVALRYE